MIIKKLKFYKNLIFFTLTISFLHIVLGVSSLFFFFSSNIDVDQQKQQIQSITNVFKILEKKSTYDTNDLLLLIESKLIDKKILISDLPSKAELTSKALLEQSKIISNIQVQLETYQRDRELALNVLLFSLIITFVFGWIVPGMIVKKLSHLLIQFKNDIQSNIEKMILNWKNANLKDNQAAYLILSLQALSLFVSFRGDHTSTQILMEISKNLSRIFDSQETSI